MKTYFTFISESNNLRNNVTQLLNTQGYRRIGSGVDAVVFSKPGDVNVIKVIVPEEITNLKDANKIAAAWYKYCEQHNSNPHLVKFTKQPLPVLKIGNQQISQYAMERLKPLSYEEHNMCADMFLAPARGYTTFEDYIEKYYDDEQYEYQRRHAHPNLIKLSKRIQKLAKPLKLLFTTMMRVHQKGTSLGFQTDIVSSVDYINVMKRLNGDIVITDPWVAP